MEVTEGNLERKTHQRILTPYPLPFNWRLIGVTPEIPGCRSKAKMKCQADDLLETQVMLARLPRYWAFFEVVDPLNLTQYKGLDDATASAVLFEHVKWAKKTKEAGLIGGRFMTFKLHCWRALVLGLWLQWRPGHPVGQAVPEATTPLRHPEIVLKMPNVTTASSQTVRNGLSVGNGLVWWRGHRVPLDILLERGWGDPQPGDLEVSQDERDVVRLYLEIWAQHGDGEAHNYLRSMREGDLFGKERLPARTVEEQITKDVSLAELGGHPVEVPICQGEDGVGRQEHHFCKPVSNRVMLCCFCGAAADRNLLEQKVMQCHEKAQSIVQSDGTVVIRKKRMQVRDYRPSTMPRLPPSPPSPPVGSPTRLVVGPKVNTNIYTLEED